FVIRGVARCCLPAKHPVPGGAPVGTLSRGFPYPATLAMKRPSSLPVSERSMTRRDVLKGAAGMATLGALPAGAAGNGSISERNRVAIIGAGTGGVAAAYFLAGSFDVDLFEARSRIGGHCDSR